MPRSLLFCLAASLLFAADPWTAREVVAPEALASEVVANNVRGPLIIHIGFDVLYRAAHIKGTPYAGPASKAEGIEELKKAVAGQPHDRAIVLYCGCCPMDKCPNIRPAFTAIHEMGFANIR